MPSPASVIVCCDWSACFTGYLLFLFWNAAIHGGDVSPEYRPESQACSSGDLTSAQTLQSESQYFHCVNILARARHLDVAQLASPPPPRGRGLGTLLSSHPHLKKIKSTFRLTILRTLRYRLGL
jgi:hypothetical protein